MSSYLNIKVISCIDKSPIEGVMIRISDDEDNTAILMTNTEGSIKVKLRNCKNYYFSQISAPGNFVPTIGKFKIYISKDGCVFMNDCLICGNTVTLTNRTFVILYYSVVYSPNGGSGGISTPGLTAGELYRIKTFEQAGIVPPVGKQFLYWNTAPDGSGETYNPGTTVPIRSNSILYAIYD